MHGANYLMNSVFVYPSGCFYMGIIKKYMVFIFCINIPLSLDVGSGGKSVSDNIGFSFFSALCSLLDLGMALEDLFLSPVKKL